MTVTLKDLQVGESGVVTRLNGFGALRHRIIDMGVTPGVTVRVLSVAPLGDPIRIRVRGYELSLRREDAARIELAPLSGGGAAHG